MDDQTISKIVTKPEILQTSFVLWSIGEFLDVEDLLSLRCVSHETKQNGPSIKQAVTVHVNTYVTRIREVYLRPNIIRLNCSDASILARLPFLVEMFTNRRKGDIYAQPLMNKLRTCQHNQCNICSVTLSMFQSHYVQGSQTFPNYSSLESSCVTAIAMHLYH